MLRMTLAGSGSSVGDALMLPELLGQIPSDADIASVTADGDDDTRKCHDSAADQGAHAVVSPRKNATPWQPSTAGAIAWNEALRASKCLGRAIWRKWSGDHRRNEDALGETAGGRAFRDALPYEAWHASSITRLPTSGPSRRAERHSALGIQVTEIVG